MIENKYIRASLEWLSKLRGLFVSICQTNYLIRHGLVQIHVLLVYLNFFRSIFLSALLTTFFNLPKFLRFHYADYNNNQLEYTCNFTNQ